MGYLRIKCHSCGKTWELYPHMMADERAWMCPRCMNQIDEQTWRNQLFPAWGYMSDANMELVKDHTGYSKPLFEVDFIADMVIKGK